MSKFVPSYFVTEFKSMQENLAKAAVKITFQVYLGIMAFSTLLATVLGFGVSLLILSTSLPIIPAIVFSTIAALVAGIAVFGFCYVYPVLAISSKVRKIDSNLPLTANFMAVLASSGMPPERIFRSLANVGDEFGVGDEMRRAIADTELMGLDLNDALKKASVRSASRKFGSMLDGIVTTAHMGGDLASFLRDESEKAKKLRVTSMKSFLDSLSGNGGSLRQLHDCVAFGPCCDAFSNVFLRRRSINVWWLGSSISFVAYDLHSYSCRCRNNVANG